MTKAYPSGQLYKAVDSLASRVRDWAVELLRFPTLQGREAEGQNYILSQAQKLGADAVDIWEPDFETLKTHPAFVSDREDFSGSPNLAATWRGKGGGRDLLLVSHIDVVPEGDLKDWAHGPFDGDIDDGVIYGRGVSDMKGTVAAMLGVVAALKALKLSLAGNLTILSTIEEETGGCGALSAVLRGYKASAAIVPEPTGFALCPAQQGGARFKIVVEGKSAHAGERLKGVSALDKLDPVRQGLLEYERYLNDTFRSVYYEEAELPFSVNVGTVFGGDWFCTVPQTATIEGRLAVPPGLTVEESLVKLKEFVYRITDADPWLSKHPPEISFGRTFWQPSRIDPDSPIVVAAKEAFEDCLGRSPIVRGTPWGTDGRMLTEFGQTPSLVFGPGTSAHCPDEFLKVSDLIDYAKILLNIVVNWCGPA